MIAKTIGIGQDLFPSGVPALAVAACAIALLRVPEVVDLVRLTSPPMMQQPRMAVASAGANGGASGSANKQDALKAFEPNYPVTTALAVAPDRRRKTEATGRNGCG